MAEKESVYIENVGCPECGSSDAVGVYRRPDNSVYGNCFSCGEFIKEPYGIQEIELEEESLFTEGTKDNQYEVEKVNGLSDKEATFNKLMTRGISKDTCEKYGVKSILNVAGIDEVHFYPHYDKANNQFYSKRVVENKKFSWSGKPKDLEFFGQRLCGSGGKMILVTEGVCDALAVVEMLAKCDKQYRVCSVVNGAGGSIKDFKNNYEWINTFESIFLAFDQDEPGQKHVTEISNLFSPNKVKNIHFSENDPNDMLVKGKHKEFLQSIFSAKESRPTGIVSVDDIFDEAITPPILGKSFPWPTLTDVTYGYRTGEIWGLGAGCYDAETEYLTPLGWRKFDDYVDGLVAQYIDGRLEFVLPTKYINVEATDMYEYTKPHGLSMVLSDNHRMVLSDYKDREFIRDVKSIREQHASNVKGLKHYKIPVTFQADDTTTISYSLDYLRLKIAVFADGSFHKGSNSNRCVIHVLKQRKIDRLHTLLKSCNLLYKARVNPDSSVEFSFYMDNQDKIYPLDWYTSSREQREVIAEECLLWDGDQRRTFTSNHKSDCDFIQFVFSSLNKRAIINEYQSKTSPHWNTTYRVNICDLIFQNLENNITSPTNFIKVSVKNNRMYCFTVPSGKLVVRRNNRIFISGNSGAGKTEWFKEMINHTIYYHKEVAGVIFLEEPAAKTLKVLAGKKVNKRFHIPQDKGGDWTIEELVEGINDLKGKVFLYNHFGSKDWESIKSKIKFMVVVLGVKTVYLDHLTALVAQEDNEYKALNKIMEEMSSLCQELDCTIFYVSHLRKANGTPHEEGGRVTADQFKGSGAIVFWSNFLIGLERNQQATDEEERNTTTLRVLKDRNTGLATGVTFDLKYHHDTGRWMEADGDEFNESF